MCAERLTNGKILFRRKMMSRTLRPCEQRRSPMNVTTVSWGCFLRNKFPHYSSFALSGGTARLFVFCVFVSPGASRHAVEAGAATRLLQRELVGQGTLWIMRFQISEFLTNVFFFSLIQTNSYGTNNKRLKFYNFMFWRILGSRTKNMAYGLQLEIDDGVYELPRHAPKFGM